MQEPLFDRVAFAGRIGEDEATFRELVELFLELEPGRMDALAHAVAGGALDDVRTQAHALAGSFRNMALDRLGERAKALEHAAAAHDIAAIGAIHATLAGLFDAALVEMREALAPNEAMQ